MKKIMMLGGNYFQATATKAAKDLGYYVISVDYLPDNPAHQFADEYHNVSTTDREAVLKLAQELKIDGIVSYASDVSAPTAAYVAEKMGLPTNPLRAVEILTHKDSMRKFMEENGFSIPRGAGFEEYEAAYQFFESIKKPAMVKPVDASGSKGVCKIFSNSEFEGAWNEAKKYSRCGKIIVEEFIQRAGHQIAGDAFLVDGKIVFAGLMNEHFDRLCNPLVPIGESYPTMLSADLQSKALVEIQRLVSLLGMKMGALNLDFIVDQTGEVYILEIGPRNGGNLITDAIRASGDVDLAKYTVLAALGEEITGLEQNKDHEFVSSYIVHAMNNGVFKELMVSDSIKKDILLLDLWVKPGDQVHKFDNGSFGVGAALIRFDSLEEMCYRMDHMEEFIKVEIE